MLPKWGLFHKNKKSTNFFFLASIQSCIGVFNLSDNPSYSPSWDINCTEMGESRCGASAICSYDHSEGTCTLCPDLSEKDCQSSSCMWNAEESQCDGSCDRKSNTVSYFPLPHFSATTMQSEYDCERQCMVSDNKCRAATFDEYG